MARLTFIQVSDTGKTKTWDVINNDTCLGFVKWHAPWRRYCFYPADAMLFDVSCLTEVIGFINGEMEKRDTGVNQAAAVKP